MLRYDAVVVGAGPAGSTASYLLADAGMRVALIDKDSFPRDKLCAGLLSAKTEKIYRQVFGDGWQDLYEYTASGARFFYRSRLLNEVDGYARMYLTRRRVFDHRLLQRAVSKGVTFLPKCRVVSMDPVNSVVYLEDGTALRADFIVGADGALSRIARTIGLSIPKCDMAVAFEIEYPRRGMRADLDRPEIHFGVVPWGYGWVFPKQGSLTIGIAGLGSQGLSMRNSFGAFLKEVCGEIPPVKWKGHPIPLRNFKLRPGKGNVLLVGDAAGFVEPLTGEGIAFAIESASYAARAILDAVAAGEAHGVAIRYRDYCRNLARFFKQAQRMRYLVFPAVSQKLFAWALERSKSVVYRYIDLAEGRIDYRDYLSFLLQKLQKRIIPIRLVG